LISNMFFMLMSSFFILSGAMQTKSLQPLGKMEVCNASAPDLMSVLATRDNPVGLLKILENADPTKVGAIILLIKDLLADTELDLETLTTAVTDANSVYDSAESAHSASVEAQTVGVAKLAQDVVDVVLAQTKGVAKLAQDVSDSEQAKVDGEAALALDVASALGKKQTALGVKIEAQRALDAEESRLVSEIERLKQLIVDIKSLATVSKYQAYPKSQCISSSTPYSGDRTNNPIFGGGGFVGTMTADECGLLCDDVGNVDSHGRPCVAYEHSSQNSAAVASCALAWACDSTSHWGGGSTYIRQ
jgi:hypothetical protein